ncbi:MAG: hypothetical protein IKX03_00490, partial [Bacteroidales bacterium]|nr:hypothetical protein [Bacteroidales bacterium]
MKNSLRHILFAALAVIIVAASCKKEEETETKPSLNGDLTFDLPEYVLKGDVVTLEAGGIIYPENIVYKWSATSMLADTVIAKRITVQIPDSIGTFSITA